MPAYDFGCSQCGNGFEVKMSIAAKESDTAIECPQCGSVNTRHVYRPAGFIMSRNAEPACPQNVGGACCGGHAGCECH